MIEEEGGATFTSVISATLSYSSKHVVAFLSRLSTTELDLTRCATLRGSNWTRTIRADSSSRFVQLCHFIRTTKA